MNTLERCILGSIFWMIIIMDVTNGIHLNKEFSYLNHRVEAVEDELRSMVLAVGELAKSQPKINVYGPSFPNDPHYTLTTDPVTTATDTRTWLNDHEIKCGVTTTSNRTL